MAAEESEVQLTEHDAELIEEGQKLVQRMDSAQLKVGKLALEFAPMGERGVKTGMGGRADMFAERVGLLPTTLRVYRSVAHGWSVTDVEDNEFSFAVLQTLVTVPDKEGLLKKLRETKPPSGRPRWGAQEALEFAQSQSYLPSSTHRGPTAAQKAAALNGDDTASARPTRTVASGWAEPEPGQQTNPQATPRDVNLGYIGETLRKMSLANVAPEDREKLDPLLAKVEGEAARLRKELNHLTPKRRPRAAR